MAAEYAQYQGGLNGYKYCASLSVRHPNFSAEEISRRLSLTPNHAHSCGEKKKPPRSGIYDSTYWNKMLPVQDGVSLGSFIGIVASQFREHVVFLQDVYQTAGRTELFIGVFANRLCDDVYPCEDLIRLGDLKIDLRLDFYGPESKDKSASTEKGEE